MVEAVSERRMTCDRIAQALASGAIDRGALLQMGKDLTNLLHEMSWEVKGHLKGRNDTPEMQQADRLVGAARKSIDWVDMHAPFALTFELARCIEAANGSVLKVAEQLALQNEGAAA